MPYHPTGPSHQMSSLPTDRSAPKDSDTAATDRQNATEPIMSSFLPPLTGLASQECSMVQSFSYLEAAGTLDSVVPRRQPRLQGELETQILLM